MKHPKKQEISPSPADYTHKSTFQINKRKAFFMGIPPVVRVDGDHTAPYVDKLSEHLSKLKHADENNMEKPRGPGEYEAAMQGQVSQSYNPPAIKFGTAIQRDDSFLKVGDPKINVSPDRYNSEKFLNPESTHVNLWRGLRIGRGNKDVDFRRVGQLSIKDDHSYRL